MAYRHDGRRPRPSGRFALRRRGIVVEGVIEGMIPTGKAQGDRMYAARVLFTTRDGVEAVGRSVERACPQP
ncbi:hypothetical protein [Streptomyces sp. SID3343]|uniref:hypothetical protein n=1 Tax=Streptomyces sp. SID3343 TaxID=2690260 RepID=UPI00136F0D34|nr:hypothetical protein [Streptomyces sp. SID3343]MYW06423.1 hypothetical protein [Streptomyces sp. SID3343]